MLDPFNRLRVETREDDLSHIVEDTSDVDVVEDIFPFAHVTSYPVRKKRRSLAMFPQFSGGFVVLSVSEDTLRTVAKQHLPKAA